MNDEPMKIDAIPTDPLLAPLESLADALNRVELEGAIGKK